MAEGFTLSPVVPREVPQTVNMDRLRIRSFNWDPPGKQVTVFVDIGFNPGTPEFFPLSEGFVIQNITVATPFTLNGFSGTIPVGTFFDDLEADATVVSTLFALTDDAIWEQLVAMGFIVGTIIA